MPSGNILPQCAGGTLPHSWVHSVGCKSPSKLRFVPLISTFSASDSPTYFNVKKKPQLLNFNLNTWWFALREAQSNSFHDFLKSFIQSKISSNYINHYFLEIKVFLYRLFTNVLTYSFFNNTSNFLRNFCFQWSL